jgi:flagellar biosynthesis/type III secretory pathway protein FliH
MALAILNRLETNDQRLMLGEILRPGEWEALVGRGALEKELEARVDVAVDQARRAADAAVREKGVESEKRMHQTLLLKAFSLQVELERTKSQLQHSFVDTVMQCLRSIIGGNVPSDFYSQVIETGQSLYGDASELVLYVSAGDEEKARTSVVALNQPGLVKIRVSQDLQRNDCYLTTGCGRVEAGLDTQLEALSVALRKWWTDTVLDGAQVEGRQDLDGGH